MEACGDPRDGDQGLCDGLGLADAAGLDDDIVEALGVSDVAQLVDEVVLEGAADASVLESHEAVVGLVDDAALLDEGGVDVHLADVVDDDGEAYAAVVGEDAVEEGGFAATEVAGEQQYGYFVLVIHEGDVLLHKDIAHNVRAHAEGFLARGLGVVVHVGVLPAVAEVALPREEADETTLPDEAVAFGGLVVVLVDFGQSVGEVVFLMIDGVAEGELDPFELREDTLHLRHDKVLQAVIVVDVEKSATDEVVAEVLRLAVGEDHVAVTGHVEEGVVEEFGAADVDGGVLRVEAHLLVLVAESDEVSE